MLLIGVFPFPYFNPFPLLLRWVFWGLFFFSGISAYAFILDKLNLVLFEPFNVLPFPYAYLSPTNWFALSGTMASADF